MTSKTFAPGSKATQGRGLLGHLAVWRARSTGRRQLAAMDARMLSDIGLSPSLAFAEAMKPFWRV
jgi:uncharacterized protein YjiS (DUF1127 family)